jgi:hypothetical protein
MTPRARYALAVVAAAALWIALFLVTHQIPGGGPLTPAALAALVASLTIGNYVAARLLGAWIARFGLGWTLLLAPLHGVIVLAVAVTPMHVPSLVQGILAFSWPQIRAGLEEAADGYVGSARVLTSRAENLVFLALSVVCVAILWLGARGAPSAPKGEPRLQS